MGQIEKEPRRVKGGTGQRRYTTLAVVMYCTINVYLVSQSTLDTWHRRKPQERDRTKHRGNTKRQTYSTKEGMGDETAVISSASPERPALRTVLPLQDVTLHYTAPPKLQRESPHTIPTAVTRRTGKKHKAAQR